MQQALSSRIIAGGQPVSLGYEAIGDMLLAAASRAPDRVFLQERSGEDWRFLTFQEAWEQASRIASALISIGLTVDRPLAILSQNTVDHALVSLGAQLAGVPAAPISVAYSQIDDLGRLNGILTQLTPGAIFAQDETTFAKAIELARSMKIPVITALASASPGHIRLSDLKLSGPFSPLPVVTRDTIAKVLFTSGSTGAPKGVIVTHGMMCSNQEAILESWPFLAEEPPVFVDWLPWNHVFGGTLNFNCIIRNAGTLVIDDGKPLPGQFQRTIENIKRFPPTMHLSVPSALAELVRAMSQDEVLAKLFFSRLRGIFSAGAALPEATWDRLHHFSSRHAMPGFRVFIGWGSTETSPVVSITPPENIHPANLGAPVSGAEIKLVQDDAKTELRLRGPMVSPGYWRNPEATLAAFDEDGFYCIGDAGKLVDPERPEAGILFDGRVAENFKLVTGTWVQVGKLRVDAISAGSPVIQDVVVTGQDREEIGLLVFPSLAGCREVAKLPAAELSELIRHPAVHTAIRQGLKRLAKGGSSTRVARAILLDTPPTMAAGEITDKGYINQRAVLINRSQWVEALYGSRQLSEIVCLQEKEQSQ